MLSGQTSPSIIAASSSQSHPTLAPRKRSGLSALRKMMRRPPQSLSSISDLFQFSPMPACATNFSIVSIAPSRSIGYVGAITMPVLCMGWRSASMAPARVLPLPRPPTNRRNRAPLLQNLRWGSVCEWCRIVRESEVDDVGGGSAASFNMVVVSVLLWACALE